MALALRFAARSDVGLIREGNEDSGYAGSRLLVVADGMGGHVAGEVASSVAATTMSALESAPGDDPLSDLADAVRVANDRLRQLVEGDPTLRGMGTTLTALLFRDGRLGLAHLGDSRCYLLRAGDLHQITRDHSFVQTLIDEGRITPAQAETHPQRSLLTRVLDGRDDVEPDLSLRESRAGDRYLLCSDGLSGVVREETLRQVLRDTPSLSGACDALVDLALRAGAPDNVTVIVADLIEADPLGLGEPLPAASLPSPLDTPSAGTDPSVAGFIGAAARGPVCDMPDGSSPAPPAADSRATGSPAQDPEALTGAATTGSTESAATSRRQTNRSSRYAAYERKRPRRRRLKWITALMLVGVLLGLAAYAGYAYVRSNYYVGADDAGNVAIFRGVDVSLLGASLSSVAEAQDLPLRALPVYNRERVEQNISASDLDDARRIVGSLREVAAECVPVPVITPTPRPSQPSSARPSPSSTRKPSVAATPTLTASVSPSVTPTPRLPAGCEGVTP